jgi:hypothetical protein
VSITWSLATRGVVPCLATRDVAPYLRTLMRTNRINKKQIKHFTTHEEFVTISTRKQVFESSQFIIKKQVVESFFVIILVLASISKSTQSFVAFVFLLSTTTINTSIIAFAFSQIFSALERHFEFRYRLDSSDSFKLLIMNCMKNVIDFDQSLKLRLYKEIMKNIDRDKWITIIKNQNNLLLINET